MDQATELYNCLRNESVRTAATRTGWTGPEVSLWVEREKLRRREEGHRACQWPALSSPNLLQGGVPVLNLGEAWTVW